MSLRVVGAGMPRTGTASLQIALERLLGGHCYHMFEVFAHPEHVPIWHKAMLDGPPDWPTLLSGYQAAVDLPTAAFWRELAAENPDALILLSVRDSPEQWWDSMVHTMFDPARPEPEPDTPLGRFTDMAFTMWSAKFGVSDRADKDAAIAAYRKHNDAVRAEAAPDRLLEWRAAEGWAPLAAALGVPVPDEPFPHVNTREQFQVPDLG